jgi:hypothetical protein
MGETRQTEPTMISVVWSSKPEEYFGAFLLSSTGDKFVLYIFFKNFEILMETWAKLARQ